MNKKINVLFSSDDNYAQHLGVAIYSLLEKNKDFEKITIFIVGNDISAENKDKLNETVAGFDNAEINWISFEKWKKQLELNMQWKISVSAYARLFIADMLPQDMDRILYLDCDMIICDSLIELWQTDLYENVIGCVQDTISDETKAAVGLKPDDSYFNTGMMLINLRAWRDYHIERKCLDFIKQYHGRVTHHDQGILNGVLKNSWIRVPLKYNVMTIHYVFTLRQINKYFNDHAIFYSVEEVETAKTHPVILHYTPSFTTRPWINNCKHPQKQLYWDILVKTSWKNAVPQKDYSKLYIKLINWRYRKLPF